jgi:hypothetical protein
MIDPTATTEMPAAESAEKSHCVPAAALAIDGAAPEVGDEVEYTVKGRVARIEGGEAYITPEMVNGQPAALAEEPAAENPDDMMAMAAQADAAMPT